MLIVDLVSTGKTLQANDLVAVEDIRPISARLIVNQAALKLKREAVQPILDALLRRRDAMPEIRRLDSSDPGFASALAS